LLGRSLAAKVLSGQRRAVVPVQLSDGTRLLLDPRGRTESGAFYHGILDEDDLDFFRCCVATGSVALDIGANIGLVSIPLGRCLRKLGGRLYCVEPVANNFARLTANVRMNDLSPITTLLQCALGDADGQMQIGRETGGGAETGNAMLKPGDADLGRSLEWTSTRVRRLDDVAAEWNLPRLDFIKIDVEGAEVGVLRGGLETIRRFRPIIYGEFSAGLMPQFNSSFADVGPLLAPLGYRAMAFIHRLDLVDVAYDAGRGNAVLCPEEKSAALRQRCLEARSGKQSHE
jgi:FkbM family methyltransferase